MSIRSLRNLLWNPWFELAALLVWVVLLLSLHTIDHRVHPLRFWSVAALCLLSAGIYMLVRYLDEKSSQREWERWHNKVRALVGDDELLGEHTDLFEYLDPDELDQVLNQDFHFGPGTVTVYTRAAPNTTSFRAEPCTSPPAAGPKARPSAHRR